MTQETVPTIQVGWPTEKETTVPTAMIATNPSNIQLEEWRVQSTMVMIQAT
jgi:hypothetical protein